jgi:hypothetical protein
VNRIPLIHHQTHEFTGWIGGVAVFDRGLTQAERSALSDVCAAGSSTVRGELP